MFDAETGRLHGGGQLRPRELALLRALWQHAGEPVPVGELLSRIWGRAPDADRGVLYTTLRRLREAVEPDPSRPRYVVTRPDGLALVRDAAPPGTLLRTEAAPLVGREDELAALARADRRVHLVGLPGMGRARLAREAARRQLSSLPGGVWGVPGDRPQAALAEQLGVDVDGLPRRLRRLQPALVVVHDPDPQHADTLRQWVRWAPSLRLWCTGRDAPGDDSSVVLVPPVARAQALVIAREALPAGLEAPDGALEALVDVVGGVPGALRAAAPLVATAGLEAALEVLCAPDGALGRLAAAWVDGESAEAGAALRQLGAFESFALDELTTVVDSAGTERWLPRLRGAGLVQPAESEGRLALAPLLQRALVPDPQARARHLAWLSELARTQVTAAGGRAPTLGPTDAARVGEWLRAAGAALDAGAPGHGELLELAIRYGARAGRSIRALFDRAWTAELDPAARVRVGVIYLQNLLLRQTPELYVVGEALCDRAVRQGDLASALRTRLFLCASRRGRGDVNGARADIAVVQEWLAGELPTRTRAWAEAGALEHRATLEPDDKVAEALYRSAVSANQTLGEAELLGRAQFILAQVEARRWRLDEAIGLLTAALADMDRWAGHIATVQYLGYLAAALARAGRSDAARQALADADARLAGIQEVPLFSVLEDRRARTWLALGRRSEARACAVQARTLATEAGDRAGARAAWCTQLLADPTGVEEALTQLIPGLLADAEVQLAVEMADLAAVEHLAGRLASVDWVVERLSRHQLGSLAVEYCTVLAELPAHREAARQLAERLEGHDDRPRLRWLRRWLAAEGGERVRPAYDDSPDPWVAVYQARLWRLLGRPVQVEIELRRVPDLATEPLLQRARADLLG